MATIDEVLGRLAKARPNGERSWMACCPAHADKNPSLSVSEGEGGRVLFKCFAGCPAESVAAALGYRMTELMGEKRESARTDTDGHGRTRTDGHGRTDTGGKRRREPFSLAGLKPGGVWKLRGRELPDWQRNQNFRVPVPASHPAIAPAALVCGLNDQ